MFIPSPKYLKHAYRNTSYANLQICLELSSHAGRYVWNLLHISATHYLEWPRGRYSESARPVFWPLDVIWVVIMRIDPRGGVEHATGACTTTTPRSTATRTSRCTSVSRGCAVSTGRRLRERTTTQRILPREWALLQVRRPIHPGAPLQSAGAAPHEPSGGLRRAAHRRHRSRARLTRRAEVSDTTARVMHPLGTRSGRLQCTQHHQTAHAGNQVMLLLLDSGSMHNFVNKAFVDRVGATTQEIKPLDVRVANGDRLTCSRMVPELKCWM